MKHSFKIVVFSLLIFLLSTSYGCIPGETSENLYVYCIDNLYKLSIDEFNNPVKEKVIQTKYNELLPVNLFPWLPPYFFSTKSVKPYYSSYASQLCWPLISNDFKKIIYEGSWIYDRNTNDNISISSLFKKRGYDIDDSDIEYAWFSPIKDEIYFLVSDIQNINNYNYEKTNLWKSDTNYTYLKNLTEDLQNDVKSQSRSTYYLYPPVIQSPDGERLLLYSYNSLFLMDSYGMNKVDIQEEMMKTINKKSDPDISIDISSAIFTPDGKNILFIMKTIWYKDGAVCDSENSFWLISVDLTEKRILFKDFKEAGPYLPFMVTPDSKKVVFPAYINNEVSDIKNKNGDIWAMNMDGSEKINITEGIEKEIGKYYGFQFFPYMSISPDGEKVVFEFYYSNENRNEINFSLGIANIDGSGVIDLLKEAKKEFPELNKHVDFAYISLSYFYPCFIPDSQNVAFISLKGPDLWTVSNDGKKYENLSKKFDLDIWDGFFKYLPID